MTLERDGMTLVIRHVPARICTNCGEEYVDEATTAQLLSGAEKAVQAGGQVHIREFATLESADTIGQSFRWRGIPTTWESKMR
jgi:hypothetical protein